MLPAATLLWLVAGLALLGLLAAGVDLDGLIAAGLAALVLSLMTAAVPLTPALQIAGFGALTLALLVGLQRWSQRRRQRSLPAASSADSASVISGFETAQTSGGRVRWQGQSWAAVNLEPTRGLQQGETVVVMGRDGTTLQVIGTLQEPGS